MRSCFTSAKRIPVARPTHSQHCCHVYVNRVTVARDSTSAMSTARMLHWSSTAALTMSSADCALADACAEGQAEGQADDQVGDQVEDQAGDHAVVQRRSRNVSDMDQTQLQRKRQTDRKAQQALRQRVKLRVAALEEELASRKDESEQTERQLVERIASLEAANAQLVATLKRLSTFAQEAISALPHEPPPGPSFSLSPGIYCSKQSPQDNIHMT